MRGRWQRTVTHSTVALGVIAGAAACDGDDAVVGNTARASTIASGPAVPATPVATDLAPSQISAATVPEPESPPPCEAGALDIAPVPDLAAGSDVAAVIAIVNAADVECEVDVFASPLADPLMEPDVWLGAGAAAEVLIEDVAPGCEQPPPIDELVLIVNGATVTVPLTAVSACQPMLTAIYAVE
jgi:hypothetical protein